MKESELIIMKRKIEQLGALMQGVLQELTNLRDLSVGTLQTIKNMPDYEEAIKKLEEQMKENETKKEGMSNGAQSHGEGYGKKDDIGLNKIVAKKNNHPTVKPIKLMKYLCRLVTPKGGTVLDPFMGSGSTGMAAKDEGFDFIGIEKEKEYFEISESRIKRFAPLMDFM